MKKSLTILLVVIAFTSLMIAVVMAENDQANIRNNTNNNTTFGSCVIRSVELRQSCYSDEKNISMQCADSVKNDGMAKTCVSDYQKNKKNCRMNFQDAKKTCIQIYKPKFWERMKYMFK